MHPRNPYAVKKPDFAALCKKYPSLEQYKIRQRSSEQNLESTGPVEEDNCGFEEEYESEKPGRKRKVLFNFKESGTVYELTKTLLLEDFGIRWSLCQQRNNLCPALTRSLNYLLWIEDLLSILIKDGDLEKNPIHGIDIGTGASCIFPLIACSLHKSWTFTGTDIDKNSLQSAEKNLVQNDMSERVLLQLTDKAHSILPKSVFTARCELDASVSKPVGNVKCFTMCNPPFFLSKEHAKETQYRNSSFQGTESELWSKDGGGEVSFIKKMINETVQDRHLQSACLFTSMVGIRKNLDSIIQFLQSQRDISFIRATTLRQGRTYRWAIAWSFLPDPSSLHAPTTVKKRNASEIDIQVTHTSSGGLRTVLKGMKQEFTTSIGRDLVLQRINESLDLRYTDRYRRSSCGNIAIYESDRSSPSFCGRILFVCDVGVTSVEDRGTDTSAVSATLLDEFGSDRKHFVTFAHRLKADVERINRFWRRRQKIKLES